MSKILIVDDRMPNREYLLTLLKYGRHELLEASNGVEALAVARAEHPDLVISDILMPVMDGLELARQLRADPSSAAIPVIFYSATYSEPSAHALAATVGVRYVLNKPAEPMAILAMVRAALGGDSGFKGGWDSEVMPPDDPLLAVSRKLELKMGELDSLSGRLQELVELGLQLTFQRDTKRLLYIACEAARTIIGARYAAIGLFADDGSVSDFTHSGMDPETVERIGHEPVGKGVLGKLAQNRMPIRIPDISRDPDAAGFPPGHPPMRSFLGVPIAAATIFGRMYFTEKIGAAEFSEQDEMLALSLASEVAVAYENARLYHEIQHHAAVLQTEMLARKKAQEELQANETRFRALIEHAPDLIIVVTPEGLARYAGPSIKQILGYSPDDIIGTSTFALLHPDDLLRVGEAFARSMSVPGASERLEFRLRHQDGSWRTMEGVGTSFMNEAGELLGIMNAQDITERKKAEQRNQLHLERLNALRTIDIAISSSFDLRLTLEVLLRQVVSLLHADAASVLLFHPITKTLEYVSIRGFRSMAVNGAILKFEEAYASEAIREHRTVHIHNLPETNGGLGQARLLHDENFVDYYCLPLLVKAQIKGTLEIFHRSPQTENPEWLDFLETLAGQAAIAIDSAQLFDGLQRSNIELSLAYDATIEGWSAALDLRDKETEGHSKRVTEMTMDLARTMAIGESELMQVRRGALLHDIGKLGIPDHILLKPGKLTDEEWEMMRKHPTLAYEMLAKIAYLKPALDIPHCHHEKWDGTGYPRGLKGEHIPLVARIFAIVDVWDAVTSDRPYRPAWTKAKALEYIKEESGRHFDPHVVDAFLRMIAGK
jgi:PAS domain S-box-containing protein/putative nucleotidyltransferase with HDIG domain